ncbi:MAG: DUF4382 domain-containing protein [Pseudomonadota bacterium]|nr:DUF4382 domain-containing protein [Pseudomonadota bacterium]
MYHSVRFIGALALISGLIACGGGGSNSDNDNAYAGKGALTLSITDAPVDGAKAVWITIDGLHLKRSGSDEKRIELSGPDVDPVDGTLTVDLLSLSGGQLSQLFHSDSVTSGDYQWVRFSLVNDSAYIVWEDDSTSDLELPANKNELKTSGSFRVGSNESVAYIIDWDLRKSIVQYAGDQYKLKPVLHLKRDDQHAYVNGIVATAIYNLCDTDGLGDDDDVPVVYVYSGSNVIPDDMDQEEASVEPVTSVYVEESQRFYVGPVDPGAYTFAFTCDGLLDDPEQDEVLDFPVAGRKNVALSLGDNGEITLN